MLNVLRAEMFVQWQCVASQRAMLDRAAAERDALNAELAGAAETQRSLEQCNDARQATIDKAFSELFSSMGN